jgi:predicted transcriptional regulator
MGAAVGSEQSNDDVTVGDRQSSRDTESTRQWTLLSNHGHVLICLARDPAARLRDVAMAVGITERAVQKIVSDLEDGGVVQRVRDGRRNRYRLFLDRAMRHPVEAHRSIGDLLGMILTPVALKRLTETPAGE